MNPRNIELMDDSELRRYAAVLGRPMPAKASRAVLMEAIRQARERTATVTLLGEPYEVRASAVRDKRVSDIVAKGVGMRDADYESVMGLLLGDEQMARLAEAVIDEDGTVDVDAVGLAYVQLMGSEELKNLRGSRG